MNFRNTSRWIAISLVILLPLFVFPQESIDRTEPRASYNMAMELLRHEKYSPARELFEGLSRDQRAGDEIRTSAAYYRAICAVELDNNDAAFLIQDFTEKYPTSPQAVMANFYLGKMQFRSSRYNDALGSLDKTDASALSPEMKDELYYMYGYAYLKSGNNTRARAYFSRLNNKRSYYYSPSRYYLAHLDYLEGKYDDALVAFSEIENDPRYRKMVPQYKLQIYYQQGNDEKVREMGPVVVESTNGSGKYDAALITGNAFYRSDDYSSALPYLELVYRSNSRSFTPEDHYQLAFCYFKSGMFKEAVTHFQKATSGGDDLAQYAYYYLGACYKKTGQDKYAANAFLSAYKAGTDPEITGEALFDYVKLSLENKSGAYDQSITLLEDYLKEHPGSPRAQEGYGYLSQLYITSKDYRQALVSMEKIPDKNATLEATYQKILYYRAVELFNNHDMDAALSMFIKASGFGYDLGIRAMSLFWAGETSFKMSRYKEAAGYYRDFTGLSGSKKMKEYPLALYGLGYAYFKTGDYPRSIDYFRKYLEQGSNKDQAVVSDVLSRLGDASFITKNYRAAISYFDKVITMRGQDVDYAIFQKALSEGALGNLQEKINVLKILPGSFASSRLADDAYYEIALTYILLNDERNALTYLDEMIKKYPSSSFIANALLKKGFIYYNRNDYQDAIRSFKAVIEKYPGTADSRDGLAALRNVYVEMNQPEQYYEYARKIPYANVSMAEEDSVTYFTAERSYLEGNFNKASGGFDRYLQQFPEGAYSLNAYFYGAESHMKDGQADKALEGYDYVIDQPANPFTETALVKASKIEMERSNYGSAAAHFRMLEELAQEPENRLLALSGEMRCYFQLKEYGQAIGAGKKLLTADRVTPELLNEAHYTLGKCYYETGEPEQARYEFSVTSKLARNETGAESKYYVALIEFESGHEQEAESQVFELSDNFTAYDYWVAKGFILLADIYLREGNTFQASQTLQSIINNYKGPELGDIARKKLEEIKEAENNQQP